MNTETNNTDSVDVVLTTEAQKKLNIIIAEVWNGIGQ